MFSALIDIDPARLRVTARTAIASCLALGIGILIGLDHPQWAAMTVWITALPTRGQRLERSLARVAGTIAGALAGVGLMALSGNYPAGIIIGLTLWLGLCAGIGNLLTGPASYISLLAGYSAAMVALLGYGHDTSLWMLAVDRVATICLGGAVGTIVALVFSPKTQPVDISRRIQTVMHACLDHIAAGGTDRAERARLIREIAALDENLDLASAGSLRVRRQARDIRSLFSALTELLLDTPLSRDRSPVAHEGKGDLLTRLNQLASQMEADCPQRAALLKALVPLWQRANQTAEAIGPVPERHAPIPLHRDWICARYAALRSMSAVAATGLVWIATGWSLGPYMVMGAAIMTSVFSTFPNPGLQMRWVVGGSLSGASAAVLAHVFIMPMASSTGAAVLLTMPLMLFGMVVMAHRRVGLAGMEYNLIYLLMMNPNLPADPQVGHALLQAFAVLMGPVSAYLAFVALPVDARRRLDFVIRLMVHELTAMAKGAFDSPGRHRHWRLRLYHRLVMLVRWGERNGYGGDFATDGGMGTLQLGNSLHVIREMMAEGVVDARSKRALRATLLSVAYLPRKPERVEKALRRAARNLQSAYPENAARLDETAALVAANQDFFRRAG
ncbi:FUSC family protein [Aliirhizobium smilacinae]|uniref:FUSC family protein n=1 Tax=Aliirhizobium smilacinae TaxID=1395944 RepID=A0A5C4XBJ5_9HYPH|nr:FUSC family protein [Rhizobium smilacinae]TNM60856.1 FUSC family protein [Rhizobium smilacinae]